ncbi:MAG: M61 family peptidase [Deltaproteobacteria bacterium]|nr:M61 family peptidase [Deltaproteobacteria bacterium]
MHLLVLALSLAAADPVLLEVDLRGAAHHTLQARIAVPARPGPLRLAFPRWIPGEHRPSGKIADLVDVRFTALGRPLAWSRDEVDPFVFQLQVPPGARSVEASLRRVAAPDTAAGGAILSFLDVILYPLGTPVREQRWQATLLVPPGWQAGSALRTRPAEPGQVAFEPVDLETLADSPVVLARHRRETPLGAPGERPVSVVMVAEEEAGLELRGAWKERLERLVAEADALFGARHFDRYCFLVAAVEGVKGKMLEHHQSVAVGAPVGGLPEQGDPGDLGYVLPHEYAHSWNGKYRRPLGMATVDFQEPLRTRDLWIYEGLTEYLGYVLSTRSGFLSSSDFRELAANALARSRGPGSGGWRTLDDASATFPTYVEAPVEWSGARRAPWMAYVEGFAAWLEADALIRERGQGRRSLDDFARAFLGGESGPPRVHAYERREVLAALDAVEHQDWKGFFAARTESLEPPPQASAEVTGWRMSYATAPGPYLSAAAERARPGAILAWWSLGLGIDGKQLVIDVRPGSPGAAAGIVPGQKVLAVDGRRLAASALERSLRAAQKRGRLELLVEDGDAFRALSIAYDGGPRAPSLERLPERPDRLEAIVTPRTR